MKGLMTILAAGFLTVLLAGCGGDNSQKPAKLEQNPVATPDAANKPAEENKAATPAPADSSKPAEENKAPEAPKTGDTQPAQPAQ